ncbi:MAG: hypothetical protein JOZ99_01080 [Actinobacteria bacterium]|nr:hypothetical protein [Actinomycetota bacterium]
MSSPYVRPIDAVARGALAGAVGTLAMDLVWFRRFKRDGGHTSFPVWEFSIEPDWDKVSAPGQVGRRVVEGFLQRPLDPKWAPLTNNVMHWGYGVVWGAQFGIVAGSLRRRHVGLGLALGPAVWASSYVVLPLAKLYKPIWQYDAKTLAKDLSAHLAYGIGTAAAFRLLTLRRS